MKVEQIRPVKLNIVGATLLSIEEAKILPLRFLVYADSWWLRSPGYNQYRAAFVWPYGFVCNDGAYVNSDGDIVVRPALKIENFESSTLRIGDVFIFGGKRFEIINNETAFCLEDIRSCAFREDWMADDANNYEKSDVKKFVNDWFEKAMAV